MKKDRIDYSYNHEIDELWNEVLYKQQKIDGINFNLENNYFIESKTINLDYIQKNVNGEDMGYKYQVLAELWQAGGDWEAPIGYFRCIFREKRRDGGTWSSYFKSIVIPKENNINLDKTSPVDAEDAQEIKNKDLWDELEELSLKKLKKYNGYYLSYHKGPREINMYKHLTEVFK